MISKTTQQTTHNETSRFPFLILKIEKYLLIINIPDCFFSPIYNTAHIKYHLCSHLMNS
jgi:hypothetical protein